MATTLFETMAGEVAAHVAGCPTAVITTYIRKVVIDLCERGKVWRVRATPLTLVAGTYSYALVPSVADTDISSILQATVTRADSGKVSALTFGTHEVMFDAYPGWPQDGIAGPPRNIVTSDVSSIQVQPVPDAATTYVVDAMLAVKPTQTSTGWDSALFSEFHRAIFHGVIHELMVMPDRKWSDQQTATYHGKQWEFFLFSAKAKANKGFGRASLAVRQRPWA